ncbi:hypothetical protein DOTSEDRAFT_89350 [Dothistroma septosporum NZE10]|uniref:Phytanoyl-CoA dioxygenase n=1 Tax=Dothistroma septosporum (strain NZE10 / CBS 128990) TaxID=675120 RepID=M2XM46_DOTSN|nr:hypothetical protein DOTSEDRAFT_89350 [Dothistroma septosporum NZE10]
MSEASRQCELRAALARDGFVRIPAAFSPQDVYTFREACWRTVEITRAGQWPHFRSLPKQFPPWNDDVSQGIWGVQNMLHPQMPDKETFQKSYFGDAVVNPLTALLQCSRDDLVMELYNMLCRPDRDFALRWHRDDIGPDVSAEVELERLQQPMLHAQWNLALYEDSSLVVLHPGDIVFYNNNILHRGVYDSKNERMTLHGSMGLVGTDPARARNILQHGIGKWASDCDFSDLPPVTAKLADGMRQRLLALGKGDDVGYSHQD